MSAGHSAADTAARYELQADDLQRAADLARAMQRNYSAGASGEVRLQGLLQPLETQGFHVLSDRLWPGSTEANVDFVVVGPTGIFIVDAKKWADVGIANGQVFQGQDDVTDRFDNLQPLLELTQAALADVGIAPGEVHAVAVFMGKRNLKGQTGVVDLIGEDAAPNYFLGRGSRLGSHQIDAALQTAKALFPPYAARNHPVELTLPDVIVPITIQQALITDQEIEEALLDGILTRPIENWMAFLHPEQARLARRSFNGPSRIRGAAGTGKTVVGLHRAAYIARTRAGRVLVTSFVKTLPIVLSSLMERMAPDVANRVEFRGIHSFAMQVLRERRVPFELGEKKAGRLFDRAWTEEGKNGVLGRIDPRMAYWKEEVIDVIKGRGLTSFDQYAVLLRTGRRRALNGESRHAVWQLHFRYGQLLRQSGICDFADIILLAHKSIAAHPLEGYSAIVADEAQDLSCAMVRMLHAIVGDAPDGLNLIGDGQQTIYPGGYTLSEANVSIAGRGVIMTRNYRNTVEIADYASSLVIGDEFMDIEGMPSAADVASEVVRHGSKPRVSRFTSRAGHDRALMQHLRALLSSGTKGGDIGVLTQRNNDAKDMIQALRVEGIPAVSLYDYDGRTTNCVKVGTIKRAKGLEFKQVVVARTPARLLEAPGAQAESAIAERRELDRRELYVAMTRARD
ncbi:MAG TPA: 3'-5' exonuclease, partial [Galbitalea sp.]